MTMRSGAVAAAFKVPLFDLARQRPKPGDYFCDDVHFDPRGAETVGATLALFVFGEDAVEERCVRSLAAVRCGAATLVTKPVTLSDVETMVELVMIR